MAQIGRNAPCPCGSGRKYKKCHGDPLKQTADVPEVVLPPDFDSVLQKRAADEIIRSKQQGQGRPIVSGKVGDYTVVATGGELLYSKKWRTFTDFLNDYIKVTLGSDWGNAELARPFEDRHPIIQWYDGYCRYQAEHKTKDGVIYSAPMTGVTDCYLGLAYNLYLIKHNAELQSRLVARLKDIKQFQGAYYELIVANGLIRAGFELELEDEDDDSVKHCEFSARSKKTGKRYWVEAKMRAVPGLLGKSSKDGSRASDPTSRLTKHLSEALKKPAPDERIIFIDLNAEPDEEGVEPPWLSQAIRRLEAREQALSKGQEAYLFVTNMAFHRSLTSSNRGAMGLAYGLGMQDFAKVRPVTLPEWYRSKQKHIDAHNIAGALQTYPHIPDTFDGRPASEAFSNQVSNRILIGERYFFPGVGDSGEVGTVTAVAVNDDDRVMHVGISTDDDRHLILKGEMSEHEYEDYKKYGDSYFGDTVERHHKSENVFEFYEWLIDCHKDYSRERLLTLAEKHPEIERLKTLDHMDLVIEVCASFAISAEQRKKQQG